MITSRVTRGAQTTLPEAVQTALRLREGDDLAYEISGDRIILTRVRAEPDDPFAAFDEWSSEADIKGYAGL
jgi:antitoxin PrlF